MTPSYTKTTRKPKPSSRTRNDAAIFPTSNLLQPSSAPSTSPSAPKLDDSDSTCSTPKAERFRIPEIGTCPPAPKKRRARAAALSFRRTPLAFFAPPDLELFFYFALRNNDAQTKCVDINSMIKKKLEWTSASRGSCSS